MKKGIIFDLDGTLWDACAAIADSWNAYLKEERADLEQYGLFVTEENIRSICGHTTEEFGDMLFPNVPDAAVRRKLGGECCSYEIEYLKHAGGKLYEGLIETLQALRKNYHLYIVSNCETGYIEDFLIWSGTKEFFEDTEEYGRTLLPKSKNIQLVMERNHLDAAVYVGDTVMDFKSSSEAGLPFIHCRYGFGMVENVPFINTLSELPERAAEILD